MSSTTGSWSLIRLALRRDRVLLPIWISIFVAMAASSASATIGLYPTVALRVHAATSFNSASSIVAFYGRIYDTTSIGALAMCKMTGLGTALVAVLTIVLVVRHTRAEEETGRVDLVQATVVGRQAVEVSAIVVAVGSAGVIGGLSALTLVGFGLPATGSIAFGLMWTSVGAAFAAIAVVGAQLTSSARAANGIGMATLAFFYLLRAVGDTANRHGPRWLSWTSPVGWGQQVRAFEGNQWWVLGLLVIFTSVMLTVACVLRASRDLGAGVFPERLGAAAATKYLCSPFALAWRLQRSSLLGWLVGFVLVGAVLGNLASNVGNLLDSGQARDIIAKLGGAKGLTDAFLAAEMGFLGIVVSGYGVAAAMRLHAEEASSRAECLLATATGRTKWVFGYILTATFGMTLLLAGAGLSAGIENGLQQGRVADVSRELAAALVQLPAALVIVAIVIATFGLVPRFAGLAWGALVAFLLLGEFGPLFGFDQWVMDISPFAHTPKLPGIQLSPLPIVMLLGVSVALMTVGLVAFRHRDLT